MTNIGLHGTSAEDPTECINRFEDENDPKHEYHSKNAHAIIDIGEEREI